MAWPTPQDYNEAVQSPQVVCSDSELKKAVPETTKLGLPKPITGNFACVYRFSRGRKEWAVRCFHRRYAGRRNRYAQISRTLADFRLPYTVPFSYLHRGIRIRGQWYPVLKMEWVRGLLLNSYIEKNISKPKAIVALADKWREMISALREAGIAHGDLQHGNILIVGGEIRLVDYDGMYVPALSGLRSNETGHPNYQHPHRPASHYGPDLDNFSAWVIYVSLVALAADPTLWEKTTRGDEALIFRRRDFEYPAQSRAFALLKIGNAKVRALASKFQEILRLPPALVPSLDEKPPAKQVPQPAPKPVPAPAPPQPVPRQAPLSRSPKPAPGPAPAPAASPPRPVPKWVQAVASTKPAPGSSAPAGPPGAAPPSPPKPAPVPVAAPVPGKARRAAGRMLAGLWWLVRAFARAGFSVASVMLVGVWWLLKLFARGAYVVFRAVLWQAPGYSFSVVGRSYRKLPPGRRRWVLAGGAVILVALSAALYAWYQVLSTPLPGGSEVSAVSPTAEEEVCEFLARPAARLYIDGEAVVEEIPPLYRAALSVGEHTVRFVSPSGVTRKVTIRVAKGYPRQWFMNFVDGKVHRREAVLK